MSKIGITADVMKIFIKVAGNYVEIGGLDTITIANSTKQVDLSTKSSVDGNGNSIEQSLPVRRGKTYSLEGKLIIDPDTGTRDAGQLAVEAIAEKTGYTNAIAEFKIQKITGDTKEFKGWAELGEIGGEKDEALAWSATIYYINDIA